MMNRGERQDTPSGGATWKELIEDVGQRLAQGKQVRRSLPCQGRLHIDRSLPFLCVFRRPSGASDDGTEHLVQGEASYLLVSGNPGLKKRHSELVRQIATTLSGDHGAFLILEVWAAEYDPDESNVGAALSPPSFRVIASEARYPTATLEALETALLETRVHRRKARVTVEYERVQCPRGFSPFLSRTEEKRLNCYTLGLEVEPVYRDRDSGTNYPLVLRSVHRQVSRAIKRSVFEFSHSHTKHRPESYQALGRRAVVKAVWEVDRKLAEISNAFDFLLHVTPTNVDRLWHGFKRSRFERVPAFQYRPLPVDPAQLKHALYEVPIERVEDPSLAFLFREQRTEIDRKLSMLRDRGSRAFLYGSLQLHGGVGDGLSRIARDVMSAIPMHSREGKAGRAVGAEEFAEAARREIEFYRRDHPQMSSHVEVRADISGIMVSSGNLFVGRNLRVPESRVQALLQHEVGTHALTYVNGRAQPFQQLYIGLAGYEELQEGLAVLAEYLVGGLSRPRLRLLAGRVLAAKLMIDGATFVETFREMNQEYGFNQRTAYSMTARVFRSGGLTKDAVYLRGLVRVLKHIRDGGDLEPLLIGKIAATHLPLMRELRARQVLKLAPLRPRYLDLPETKNRLSRLRNGIDVVGLLKGRRK